MDITELIRNGESETLEFKEGFEKDTIDSVVSFSNTKGGMILIGVSDKRKIVGVQVTNETLSSWVNQISQATDPRIIPDIYSERIDGKTIVVITVKESPLKPVSTKGKCYRRISTSNRTMTPQEVAQMHLNVTGVTLDSIPINSATMDDIDIEKFKKYVHKANAVGRRNIEENDDGLKTLRKIELITEGRPTLAAIVLFGRSPQDKVLQATVHCGRFKHETMIIDDRLIKGTAFEQVEETMDFIRKNIDVKFVMTGKPERDEVWDYPLDALREAVINAICHRDYTDNSDIQIKIHDDRMTIWNPGGLPFGMTMKDLFDPNHSSKPRNKLIAQSFFDVKLIERYGGGIEKILSACKTAGLPAPTFEEKFGGFLVIFRKDAFTEEQLKSLGLNDRQVKAVLYVKEKGNISNEQYQRLTGVKRRTASYDLKELVTKKIFEQIGAVGKGTYYKIR